MEKFDSRIGDCHSNDDVLKIAAVLFLTCDSHYRCGISLCLSFGTKMSWGSSCMIIPYAMMYSQLAYAFVTILLNVLYAWGVKMIPSEIIFLKIPLFHRWCLIQSRL